MNAKLTLTIDKEVIEKAKRYAKSENRSLSNLIESFLRQVTHNKVEKEYDIHPEIAALRGSVKVSKDFSFDYKKELQKAKDEKFSKYLND
jgi:predicted HicB family RNase H-like nuclease